jgi:ribonuclease HI
MIEYYTDGSASPNPGPGGFAVIKNGVPYIYGGEAASTNIRMEGLAILAALQDADGAACTITTDSEFWINVLTKWAPVWESNNWHKKGGIKNLDIVQPLFKLHLGSRAKLVWTRGHVGTELNELADQWANQARKMKIHKSTKI